MTDQTDAAAPRFTAVNGKFVIDMGFGNGGPTLRIFGDFPDDAACLAYAQAVARALNGADIPGGQK